MKFFVECEIDALAVGLFDEPTDSVRQDVSRLLEKIMKEVLLPDSERAVITAHSSSIVIGRWGFTGGPTASPVALKPPARATDPDTSKKVATEPSSLLRWNTQRHRLLKAYADGPMSDEQAGHKADLSHIGYWKRCSELRTLGMIESWGTTTQSRSGNEVMVCAITEQGKATLNVIQENHTNKGAIQWQ